MMEALRLEFLAPEEEVREPQVRIKQLQTQVRQSVVLEVLAFRILLQELL
jgi:hypothetical protein